MVWSTTDLAAAKDWAGRRYSPQADPSGNLHAYEVERDAASAEEDTNHPDYGRHETHSWMARRSTVVREVATYDAAHGIWVEHG